MWSIIKLGYVEMRLNRMYVKYCCGCGLCHSTQISGMKMDDSGFCISDGVGEEFQEFCSKVCPASGIQMADYDITSVWGRNLEVYLAYSTDTAIRYEASSGGVLTSLCTYLIEKHIVDGIIHTASNPDDPIGTSTFCSISSEELKNRCGSRYSASTPLINITDFFIEGKTFAYVGKPCDVTALRNYSKIDKRVNKHIKYMFSFFCAGAPSEKANLLLLKKLGISYEECQQLRYRGNGWPGYAVAISKTGIQHKMSYDEAWGGILGRDIRPICRCCMDGIGELADISCGDAWYLDSNKNPDFSEAEGRNIVFCRNENGLKLFKAAVNEGYIHKDKYLNWIDEIKYYQKYQLQRRRTMHITIMAMKSMGLSVPSYSEVVLRAYAKNISFKENIRRYLGTIKRIFQGRIN